MAVSAPLPDAVDRFRGDVQETLRGEHSLERFAVAVSGGPDSLALLLLAHAAFPGCISAVTVDHGLRLESAGEAVQVAEICAALSIPHRVLNVSVAAGGNLQSLARQARYDAIGAWLDETGTRLLMTAHHLDDQAETLVMRLLRGAGVRGLAGVPGRAAWPTGNSPAAVLRPLLGWRRAELAAIVAQAGLTAADDPSNNDERFERVRIRRQLADSLWLDPAMLGRSAAALRDADEALDWAAARLWKQTVVQRGTVVELESPQAPPEIVRRLLLSVLRECGARTQPRTEELARLAATLAKGGTATLAGIKCTGGPIWRFEPAPPRRPTNAAP